MKKTIFSTITFIMLMVILAGCSAVEEVNNSINYVDKAADYINKMRTFADEVPPLIDKATTDPATLEQLDEKLKEIQKEIESFNQLTPPDFAKDIHSQVLEHNQQLENAIKLYTESVEQGEFDPSTLKNSDLMNQIDELTQLIDQIQSLGE